MKRFAFALLYTIFTLLIFAAFAAGLAGVIFALVKIGPLVLIAIPVGAIFYAFYQDTDEDGVLRA